MWIVCECLSINSPLSIRGGGRRGGGSRFRCMSACLSNTGITLMNATQAIRLNLFTVRRRVVEGGGGGGGWLRNTGLAIKFHNDTCRVKSVGCMLYKVPINPFDSMGPFIYD